MKKIFILILSISFFLNSCSLNINNKVSGLSENCAINSNNFYSKNRENIIYNYFENIRAIEEKFMGSFYNGTNHKCLFYYSYYQIENGYRSYTFFESEPYGEFTEIKEIQNKGEVGGFGGNDLLERELIEYIKTLNDSGFIKDNFIPEE